MVYSAFADLVLPENLLEEKNDFIEEVYDAFFVAGAGAVFGRIGRFRRIDRFTCLFSATVTVSVIVSVGVTESRTFLTAGNICSANNTENTGSLAIFSAGCRNFSPFLR